MTESGSRNNPDNGERIISASELAEFDYCALSWYYTREGYRVPADRVERMNRGTIAHEEADTDRERNSKLSVTLIVAILLVIVFMFIVFV